METSWHTWLPSSKPANGYTGELCTADYTLCNAGSPFTPTIRSHSSMPGFCARLPIYSCSLETKSRGSTRYAVQRVLSLAPMLLTSNVAQQAAQRKTAQG